MQFSRHSIWMKQNNFYLFLRWKVALCVLIKLRLLRNITINRFARKKVEKRQKRISKWYSLTFWVIFVSITMHNAKIKFERSKYLDKAPNWLEVLFLRQVLIHSFFQNPTHFGRFNYFLSLPFWCFTSIITHKVRQTSLL